MQSHPGGGYWAGIRAIDAGDGQQQAFSALAEDRARGWGGEPQPPAALLALARFPDPESAAAWLTEVVGLRPLQLVGALVAGIRTVDAAAVYEQSLLQLLERAKAGEILDSLDGDSTRLAAFQNRGSGSGPAPEDSLQPGFVLSHTYRFEAVIGSGGMGTVFRARHVELGTLHAIKVISPAFALQEQALALFRREAETLRRVRHDAVVGYEAVIRDEAGRLFLVMEYVPGPTLARFLGEGGVGGKAAEQLLQCVGDGLDAAHERGVVHRDLSPDNIILCDGDPSRAKLIDFGIARDLDPVAPTLVGSQFAGRLAYASPEQLGMVGEPVGPRSDIYSMGLVLAAALGSRLPMGDNPAAAIAARTRVPVLDAFPEVWRARLAWMLQPDPRDRPETFRALSGAVRAEARTDPARTTRRPRAGLPRLAFLGGATFVLLGIAGGVVLIDTGESPVRPLSAVADEVRDVIDSPDCSYLESQTVRTAESGYTVVLRGVAPDTTVLDDLSRTLRQVEGVAGVELDVDVHAPPFCALSSVLASYGVSQGVPALELNRDDGMYRENDQLSLRVIHGGSGDKYVYVVYMDREGTLIHFAPNPVVTDNLMRPDEELILGAERPDGEHRIYRAVAPFGDNMIAAILVDQPLFDDLREEVETIDTFLPELSQQLGTLAEQGASPRISSVFFRTEP